MHPLSDPNTLVPLATVVFTLGYAATCALWPFTTCRRCHGTGQLRSPLIRAIRLCPHCQATGLRIRTGRHLYNLAARLHRANRRNRRR